MKKILAEFFNIDERNVFLFAKGRVGLYATLKALHLAKGDEIIVPGYTCMVVPSAAYFLHLKCKYIDIDPLTYNINPSQLNDCLTDSTKILVVQHTYGIPADMDPILNWAARNNILIIEDCCHAFGSRYKGRLCGTFGAASFFSGQWNKPFSTGLGGMLLVNDPSLLSAVQAQYREAAEPGFFENARLCAQIMVYNSIVMPRTTALITELYRFMSKRGIAAGSSSSEELAGRMPFGYFKKMAPCQLREGRKNLRHIEQNITARKENTAFYSEILPTKGFLPLREKPECEPVMLRYPVRVANKREVLQRSLQHHFEIGSWFEVPLHPEGTDMESFGYHAGMCPQAEKASHEVINLPTHQKITRHEGQKLIDFIEKYAKPILS